MSVAFPDRTGCAREANLQGRGRMDGLSARAAISELPALVVAPTPDTAVGAYRARVILSDADRDSVGKADDGGRALGRQVVSSAELASGVVSPAAHASVCVACARVLLAHGDLDDIAQPRDLHGSRADVHPVGVVPPAVVAVAPATDRAVAAGSARQIVEPVVLGERDRTGEPQSRCEVADLRARGRVYTPAAHAPLSIQRAAASPVSQGEHARARQLQHRGAADAP